MRELAMRAVHPPPRLDQIEDRLLLAGQQPVHRIADRRPVLQTPGLPQPRTPAVRADVGEVQHPARARVRPPVLDGAVDQPQQLELGLGAHARGDRAEKPERLLVILGVARPLVVSASTAAGRGPRALARARAEGRPAPPGGVRCRKRQQDVAPL